jgi:hypothetical protein
LLFAVCLAFLVETSSIFPFLFALPWMSLLENWRGFAFFTHKKTHGISAVRRYGAWGAFKK